MRNKAMKKIVALLISIVLILMTANGSAYSESVYERKAIILQTLGILQGSNSGFELDREATRVEGAVILARLLGKESDATKENNPHPFSDVPEWASPYIGYLYKHNLINGVSENEFGAENLTADQFFTLLLRVLKYSDKDGDFLWNTSIHKSLAIGLIDNNELSIINKGPLTREKIVLGIYNSLKTKLKNSDKTLIEELLEQNCITKEQIDETKDISLATVTNLFFQRTNRVNYNVSYAFKLTGKMKSIKLISLVPNDYANRQKVINMEYSLEPSSIFYDGDNKYAQFDITNPQEDFSIDINCTIDLLKYDFTAANKFKNVDDLGIPERNLYLSDEKYIEKNDPFIKRVKFYANNNIDLLRKIYNYVIENMTYKGYVPTSQGAVDSLNKKSGDCTDYADLLVALCRANNIPARTITGWTAVKEDKVGRNWPEVYLDDYGWIPFDPMIDDTHPTGITVFENIKNQYIYLSFIRNDKNLNYGNFYRCMWKGEKVQVTRNVEIK